MMRPLPAGTGTYRNGSQQICNKLVQRTAISFGLIPVLILTQVVIHIHGQAKSREKRNLGGVIASRKVPRGDLEIFRVLPCIMWQHAGHQPEVNGQCVVLEGLNQQLQSMLNSRWRWRHDSVMITQQVLNALCIVRMHIKLIP
jgi:hypothetical protein